MKKLLFSLLFLFALINLQAQQQLRIITSTQIEDRNGKQYYLHQVEQGQTVYAIAKAYEVSVDEIYYENPGSEKGIAIDQVLWIPTVSKENEIRKEIKTADFDFFYHIASTNESLSHIAETYNISLADLRNANPFLSMPLRKGEYIKIPVPHDAHEDDVSFNPNIAVIPDFRHTVRIGETLAGIAQKYNTTPENIRAVNPGLTSSPSLGQRLRIPQEESITKEDIEEVPQKIEYLRYAVRKKETLYSIARTYGVTIDDLYDANENLTAKIYVGEIIRIPRITIANSYIIHKITSYTKLKKVAKLYRISTDEILNINPSLGSKLYPGQTVKIPVGKKATIEKNKPLDTEKDKEEVIEVIPEPPVPIGCNKERSITNKTFQVALMIPLFLEEMDSLDFEVFSNTNQDNFKPFRFIHFYEGILLAVDSMRSLGMKIDLTVYDVDKSITKTTKVLQKKGIRKADLIIGPFYQQSFDQVALFAGNFNIPIVNPLSYRQETVEKYRTVIKIKSGETYQDKLLETIIPQYYEGSKVFIVSQTAYKAADRLRTLQNKITSVIPNQIKYSNADIYNLAIAVAHRDEEYEELGGPLPTYNLEGLTIDPEMISEFLTDSTTFDNSVTPISFTRDGFDAFMKTASPLRANLVLIHGDNKSFVMDVMNRLNEFRDSLNIKVIGMPEWERFNNLDIVQSNNLELLYFSTSHLDYNAQNTMGFIDTFKAEYETEPNEYGFAGYDISLFMLNALFRFDRSISRCLPHLQMKMLSGFYQFANTGHARNMQNTYWNILRYTNYQLHKLPDPVLDPIQSN